MRDISPAVPAALPQDGPLVPDDAKDDESRKLLEAMEEFISLPLA